MAHQDGLHAALPQKLQLYPQPFEVLIPWLFLGCASIDCGVGVEEIEGIEAENGKLVGDDLDEEPATSFKTMALFLGDKFPPDVGKSLGPSVGTLGEDVMRKDIVVAKIGHNGYGEVVGGIGVIDVVLFAKDFNKLVHK